MAAPNRAPVTAPARHGFADWRLLDPRWEHLHAAGTERDGAGHRQVLSAHHATVLRLSCLRPLVPSLRGLHAATTVAKGHGSGGNRP